MLRFSRVATSPLMAVAKVTCAILKYNNFKLLLPKSSGIFRRSRIIPLPESASLKNLSGFLSDAD